MLPSLFGSNCVRSGHDLCNRSGEAGRGEVNVREVENGGNVLIWSEVGKCADLGDFGDFGENG